MRTFLSLAAILLGALLVFGELALSILLLIALGLLALWAITHLLRGFFPWAYRDDDRP